jgi:hypothetical protein
LSTADFLKMVAPVVRRWLRWVELDPALMPWIRSYSVSNPFLWGDLLAGFARPPDR